MTHITQAPLVGIAIIASHDLKKPYPRMHYVLKLLFYLDKNKIIFSVSKARMV